MENEAIIRKLRALLAKAEGTIGPESDAFMEKVRELLVKHQLEIHQIKGEADLLEQHDFGLIVNSDWEVCVCSVGAEYLGCATLFTECLNGIACTIYGRHSACVTTYHMLNFWLKAIVQVANRHMLPYELVGFAFCNRVQALLKAQGAAPSNGTDLVPISTALTLLPKDTEDRTVEGKVTLGSMMAAEEISLHLQATDETVDLRRLK